MFENLNVKLEQAFRNLKGEGKMTDVNVAETMREVRRALLDADVNYNVAREFTNRVKEEALGQKITISVKPGQMLVKIMHDELTQLMGGEQAGISFSQSPPTVILIAGLQGSGKTTFTGKLARHLKSEGRNPLLAAGDVYRPAAIDQLGVLGEQIGVDVYEERDNKNPVEIAENAIKAAKSKGKDVVIVDTAGRLAVDEAMMTEIVNIKEAVNPDEILFVVDAMTGQDAVNTAKAFNERLDFDGVVLTKLDGDTRGGAAISIREVVEKPIKFISRGEKLDALDLFYPDRMASRILGMGDVVSLVDKVQQQFDEKEQQRLEKRFRSNQLDLNDLLSQISAVEKMGNLKDLISMLPGFNKMMRGVDISDDAFRHVKAIIYSMTLEERANPRLLNGSRRRRIARGAGRSVREVNELVSQFEQMKKAMKQMNKMSAGGKLAQAALKRGGRSPFRRR